VRFLVPLLLALGLATGAFASRGPERSAAWKPKVEVARSGVVRAELSYQHRSGQGPPEFRNLRLKIYRADQLRRDEALGRACAFCTDWPAVFFAGGKSVTARDLERDGEPEVVVDLYTGGAHCCTYSLLFDYVPGADRYVRIRHEWGDPGYRFTDSNHDRAIELSSADDRFAYRFTCYACSPLPVQIWSLRAGKLVDVTRTFPAAVRRDAGGLWRLYLRERSRPDGDVRGILAAYLAEKYLLGTEADGWRRLRQANARGDLHPAGQCSRFTPCDAQFLARLGRFLRQTGYRSGA